MSEIIPNPYHGFKSELAKRLGCSKFTVTNAMKGKGNSKLDKKIRQIAREALKKQNINPQNTKEMTQRNSVKVRQDGSLLLTTTDGQHHEFYGFSALVNYLKEQNIDVDVNDITEEL